MQSMIEQGAIRPVVDERFTLEHIAEAHARVETGGRCGNVVVTIAAEDPACAVAS